MKKMKLFATVSVFCLGIAAVANTQSHSKTTISGYKPDNSNNCTVEVTNACTDQDGSDCFLGTQQLFRFSSSGCPTGLKKI